ncbi:NAD(P)-binding domain-containing protein [Streptomyces albidoflavus]|uniref:NAD(P)-binding domain-containing protein n=1 Tax=Streptomyces albidoflavus TaxID=1886 RepID=UPI0013DBC2B8|nr:NAD(P)/FAD-dependent oxidoreductase [Streptomyces albidoflavus]
MTEAQPLTLPTPSPTPAHTVHPVYVIGGGPGGLAVAAALRGRGVRAVVLEKADAIGAAWRGHYERLRLTTTRRHSALPGVPMPRSFGRWTSRADLVRYLDKYAEFHELEIVTGVEVARISPAEWDLWRLEASGGRVLTGSAVVVATGWNHTPYLPEWPGRETWTGTFLHASRYRDARPYEGQDVLVVGAGATGCDLAVDLAEGGAARVRLAVRTPPHLLRRSTLGWPAQRSARLARRLPAGLADALLRLHRIGVPDLSAHGLPRPSDGPYSRARAGRPPVHTTELAALVAAGSVEPVAAVESFDGADVVLADGSRVTPDTVIAATGYRRGLEELLDGLDLLTPDGTPGASAPGLYFTGFADPADGTLRHLSRTATRTAKALPRDRSRRLRSRPSN